MKRSSVAILSNVSQGSEGKSVFLDIWKFTLIGHSCGNVHNGAPLTTAPIRPMVT